MLVDPMASWGLSTMQQRRGKGMVLRLEIAPILAMCSSLLMTVPGSLSAQRAFVSRHLPDSATTTPSAAALKLFPRAHDHRYEGLVIGAVAVGGAFAVIGNALCRSSDSVDKDCAWGTVKVGLLGGFAGGLSGALIGALVPKKAPPRPGRGRIRRVIRLYT